MKEIAQIRRLSLWIFLIPLLAINLCLTISQKKLKQKHAIYTDDNDAGPL